MTYTLFDHQKKAVEFAKNKSRFALLMAPRSGKTLTSLHILIKERGEKNVFIVCPTKVKTVWKKEVEKYFPDMRITIVNKTLEAEQLSSIYGVCIISPKLLKSVSGPVSGNIICDESHLSKGGQILNVLKKHCDHARNVIILSATPADNRPRDLYSVFRLLKHPVAYLSGGEQYKGDESKKYSFLYRFCFSGYVNVRTARGKMRTVQQYSGLKNKEELMRHLNDCAFRYFPEEDFTIEKKVVEVKLNEVERQRYEVLFDEYIQEQRRKGRRVGTILTAKQMVEMIKCREYISLLKATAAVSVILENKDSHKIAFSSFRISQKYLMARSELYATDDMEQWKVRGGLFVSSPERSGMGVEMVEAKSIYMIDLSLRAKNNLQALARTRGPNQQSKELYNTFFVATRTVDERVLEILRDKMQQFDKIEV